MGSTWFSKMGIQKSIPGTTGRKIPGAPNMPSRVGGFMTNVKTLETASHFREAHHQQVRDSRGQFGGGWGYAWQGLAASAAMIERFTDNTLLSIEQSVNQMAQDMLAYAKENAPWEDHPGEHEDARDNLQVQVVKVPDRDEWTILLGHGKNVYYGIWLEVRNGGQYAILLPTLYKFAPTLGNNVKIQT